MTQEQSLTQTLEQTGRSQLAKGIEQEEFEKLKGNYVYVNPGFTENDELYQESFGKLGKVGDSFLFLKNVFDHNLSSESQKHPLSYSNIQRKEDRTDNLENESKPYLHQGFLSDSLKIHKPSLALNKSLIGSIENAHDYFEEINETEEELIIRDNDRVLSRPEFKESSEYSFEDFVENDKATNQTETKVSDLYHRLTESPEEFKNKGREIRFSLDEYLY